MWSENIEYHNTPTSYYSPTVSYPKFIVWFAGKTCTDNHVLWATLDTKKKMQISWHLVNLAIWNGFMHQIFPISWYLYRHSMFLHPLQGPRFDMRIQVIDSVHRDLIAASNVFIMGALYSNHLMFCCSSEATPLQSVHNGFLE